MFVSNSFRWLSFSFALSNSHGRRKNSFLPFLALDLCVQLMEMNEQCIIESVARFAFGSTG